MHLFILEARFWSMKAQASSELLLILSAVLIIGLVVIGLFVFYSGNANETNQAQSDLYWRNARPISVIESLGSTKEKSVGVVQDTTILSLANRERGQITITNITIDGNSNELRYGGQISIDGLGHQVLGPDICNTLTGTCAIPISPGETITIQIIHSSICNQPISGGSSASANSVRRSADVELAIKYERDGIPQAQYGAVKLRYQCHDFFNCQSNDQCTKYGAYAPSCVSGACVQAE